MRSQLRKPPRVSLFRQLLKFLFLGLFVVLLSFILILGSQLCFNYFSEVGLTVYSAIGLVIAVVCYLSAALSVVVFLSRPSFDSPQANPNDQELP